MDAVGCDFLPALQPGDDRTSLLADRRVGRGGGELFVKDVAVEADPKAAWGERTTLSRR
jgi:hypothetical protein